MRQDPQTFPPIRTWQRMSEREQNALLDRIEAHRRRRSISWQVLVGALGAAAIIVVALIIAF
jgi:hypothetical protein